MARGRESGVAQPAERVLRAEHGTEDWAREPQGLRARGRDQSAAAPGAGA